MPRSADYIPKYRKHRQSGQPIVILGGKDFHLGPHGTKASRMEYDRRVLEWIANGRRLPTDQNDSGVTVAEVINAYRKFAERYYRKNGKVTREYGCIKESLKIVRELYGRTEADDFGPLALKAVRQRMIENGWSRIYVNKSVGRIRRCFKWAVENELVKQDVYHGLMAVSGLRKGRSEAHEPGPVLPVEDTGMTDTERTPRPTARRIIRPLQMIPTPSAPSRRLLLMRSCEPTASATCPWRS